MTRNKKYTPDNKYCLDCQISLNYDNIRASDLSQANYICCSCRKIRDQNRYINNKANIRIQQKQYELNNKIKIIEAYGGKCICCQETALEFLTIDHVNDNGAEERKDTNQGTGGKLYRWLIKRNFPKDNYQLLCYNCNCAKGFFGYCPHQK